MQAGGGKRDVHSATSRKAVADESLMVHEGAVHLARRNAPRDGTRHLHAVEGARSARVLDANAGSPRYLCIGFGVIRL
jgi:hypothetical protein